MKSIIILVLVTILISLGLTTTGNAQSRVNEEDLRGTWKLVIEVDEEGENALERVIIGTVQNFLDELEIQFQFKSENELKIIVNAFGEEEVEYSEWSIMNSGAVLMGDNEHFDTDDTVWFMHKDRLVAYEKSSDSTELEEKEYYLEKIY